MKSWTRIPIAAIGAIMVSGCGAYLHDARVKTSTADLKTTFETLQAPAMFAELKQREKEFSAEEDRIVAEQAVVTRNTNLAAFMRSPSIPASLPAPQQRTAMDSFRSEVAEELKAAYGSTAIDPAHLNRLFNAPDVEFYVMSQRNQIAAALPSDTADFIEAQKQFNLGKAEAAKDKRKTDCDNVLKVPEPTGDSELDVRYGLLWRACDRLRKLDEPSPGKLRGILASASSDSQLGVIAQELGRLSAAKAEAEKEKKKLTDEIKSIADRAKTKSGLDALNETIKQVGNVLAAASPYARQAGLEQLSELVEEALAAELEGGVAAEEASESETTVRAAAALQLLRAMAQLEGAVSPDPAAKGAAELLLAAAHLRHQLRMVQVDVARDEALRKNYEAQARALLIKTANLARVWANLQNEKLVQAGDFSTARKSDNETVRSAAGEALASYIVSWNQGEIPRRVLLFRNVQIKRASALERAALTEEDYRTSLKPVFDELAAYGEGGIKPETIVELLGQLGVAGAILGEK